MAGRLLEGDALEGVLTGGERGPGDRRVVSDPSARHVVVGDLAEACPMVALELFGDAPVQAGEPGAGQVVEHRVADEGVGEDVLAGVDLSDQAGGDRRVEGVDGGFEVEVEHPSDDLLVEPEAGDGGGIERSPGLGSQQRETAGDDTTHALGHTGGVELGAVTHTPVGERTNATSSRWASRAARKKGLPSVCRRS